MGVVAKIVGGVVGAGIAVFGGVNAFGDETERDASGAIVEAGGLGVFEMQLGDCVQLPDGGEDEVASVEGVPCTQPHDAQVYAQFDIGYLAPAGLTPQQAEIEEESATGCFDRWADTIGTDYHQDAEHDFTTFYPTTEGWGQGDHGVTCLLVGLSGSLVGDRV